MLFADGCWKLNVIMSATQVQMIQLKNKVCISGNGDGERETERKSTRMWQIGKLWVNLCEGSVDIDKKQTLRCSKLKLQWLWASSDKTAHIPVCLLEFRINLQVAISMITKPQEPLPSWPQEPGFLFTRELSNLSPMAKPQEQQTLLPVDSAASPSPSPWSIANVNPFRTADIFLPPTWCIKILANSRATDMFVFPN